MHVRQVERREVLVVEGGPLASIGVVRLEGLGSPGILDDCVHAGSDLLHDPEVRVACSRPAPQGSACARAACAPCSRRRVRRGSRRWPGSRRGPGRSWRSEHVARVPSRARSPRCLVPLAWLLPLIAHVDRRRRALEDESSPTTLASSGIACTAVRACADDADALPVQIDVVVPARRVERLAIERLHPVDACGFGVVRMPLARIT